VREVLETVRAAHIPSEHVHHHRLG
jgi:hypothetical protein